LSANVPTDICFSFTGLIRRGGETGPHIDGFGICFYESGGLREFKDYQANAASPIAEFLRTYPILCKVALDHIRQASVGEVNLQNTHPFQRELWGRAWTFAHNGQSALLQVPQASERTPLAELAGILQHYFEQLNRLGVCNLMLSDGNG